MPTEEKRKKQKDNRKIAQNPQKGNNNDVKILTGIFHLLIFLVYDKDAAFLKEFVLEKLYRILPVPLLMFE